MSTSIDKNKPAVSRKMAFTLLCLSFIATMAQTEYIQTETSIIMGANVKVIVRTPSNNAQFIDVATKGDTIRYTADDIVEYGSRYGKIYVSKEINIGGTYKRVFLDRLVMGDVNLYLYKERNLETFFIERTTSTISQFLEVTNDEKREILSKFLNDCEWISGPVKIVKYNKKSLAKLISQYNSCEQRPFSYIKFGGAVGIGRSKMISSSKFGLALQDTPISFAHQEINATSIEPDVGVMAGIFVDIPFSVLDYSLVTGIYYYKNSFETSAPVSDIISVDITSIEIPVLLRYTFPKKVARPFVNFGPIFNYHSVNINGVFEDGVNTATTSFVANELYGFSAGGGVAKNLDHRKTMSLEFRFSKFFGDSRSLGKNQADLIFAVTL